MGWWMANSQWWSRRNAGLRNLRTLGSKNSPGCAPRFVDGQRSYNWTNLNTAPLTATQQRIILKMAEDEGGIDRKADERMEFSTSKGVTVHPTFESMSLKGKQTSGAVF